VQWRRPAHQPVVLDVLPKVIDDQDQELELLRPDYRSPIPRIAVAFLGRPKHDWRGATRFVTMNCSALKISPHPTSPAIPSVVKGVFEDAYTNEVAS